MEGWMDGRIRVLITREIWRDGRIREFNVTFAQANAQ